jgi:hypothetical protein
MTENVASKVSTYAHVHGQHDYMKCSFAPLGCVVMAHIKPKNRQSWDVYTDTGFNIGTAMEHNQCYHIYIVKTRATRISDTVFFKHQYITNPKATPKTLVIRVASDLTSALKKNDLTQWQDGRGVPKAQLAIHKDSCGKIRISKGKRAMEQSLKSPQCLPSCTTSKGGLETTYPIKPTSKGANRNRRG